MAPVVEHLEAAVAAGAAYAAEEDAYDLEAKVAPFQDTPRGNAYGRTAGSSYASSLFQGTRVSDGR